MLMTRRKFVSVSTVGISGTIATAKAAAAAQPKANMDGKTDRRPVFIATWPFGKPANDVALKTVQQGGSTLDAVEAGIRHTEADESVDSVGLGGIPNAGGVVQLDASIMTGPKHRAGSVAALEGIVHAISVARRVMERTPHVMLVGAGARQFALEQGFPSAELLTEKQKTKWLEWKAKQLGKSASPSNHDTIALLGLDAEGNLYGGCSTSGWGYKLPGRVGDSPIIGSGLYVDNDVGAAGATGLGENVMRYCGSFLVVELMRQGRSPEEACVETIRRIARQDPRGIDLSINFIALDKKGRYAAAGTGKGFEYTVATDQFSEVLKSVALSNIEAGPIGGNRQ